MSPFKKILCPTDFSEASCRALVKAVELAEASAAELCVIHVEPAPDTLTPLAGLTPDAEDVVTRRVEAVSNLCAVLDEIVPSHVSARPLLKSGDAAKAIVDTARDEGADLIVLTTHGARGFHADTLGSVAEQVLRTAHNPVLTLNGCDGAKHEGVAPLPANASAGDALRPELLTVSAHKVYVDGD